MKTLPLTLYEYGFTLTQVERYGNLAIYHKQKLGQESECWEVVTIGSHDGFVIGGKTIEPAETYPTSESWGVGAFTLYSLQDARNRVTSMQERPIP